MGTREKFDADTWWERCEKFRRNREALHASIKIYFDKEGILRAKVTGCEKKYIRALIKLGEACADGLTVWYIQGIHTDYAIPKDKDTEHQKQLDLYKENYAEILSILLNNSVQSAVDYCDAKRSLLQIQYEAPRFYYKDGDWHNPNGEILSNGAYIGENGKAYFCRSAQFWTQVFPSVAYASADQAASLTAATA